VEAEIMYIYKVSKYFMRAEAELIKREDKEECRISFIVRHDGGDKFSYFCACYFFIFSLTLFVSNMLWLITIQALFILTWT
jgi:hypothetical protein